MSDSVKIAEASRLARLLKGTSSVSEEDIRNRVAREFFGEAGIPAHLAEGWAVFDDWRNKRAEAGYPVPPGGTLVTGYSSVLAAVAADLHTKAAAHLRIDAIHVRVVIKNKEFKVLVPNPPTEWVLPVANGVAEYVASETADLVTVAMMALMHRCAECAYRRVDLDPEVAPVRSAK